MSDPTSLDKLREECLDCTLSSIDFLTPSMYKGADGTDRPCVGKLSIPTSNADAECGFSMLRKIHTDQCSNLSQSTIIALMSIKLNCEDCCTDTELYEDLLKNCKKATTVAVKK